MPGHVFTQPHIVRSSAQKRSKDVQMDMNESGQWSREVKGWKVTLVLTPEVSLQLCGLCCHHLSSLLLLFRSPLSGLLFSGTHTAGLQMMTKCRQCIDKSGKCVFFSCFLATSIQPPPSFYVFAVFPLILTDMVWPSSHSLRRPSQYCFWTGSNKQTITREGDVSGWIASRWWGV